MNSASAKVFAFGENACTPQKRRRPEGRLCGASIPFRDFKISILTGPSKIKGHLLCRCLFILGSAAQRAAPPFGFSMLGAAEPPFRQGFCLRQKRLYGALAPRPRRAAGRFSYNGPSIQNIDFNRPFQNKRACCKIEF